MVLIGFVHYNFSLPALSIFFIPANHVKKHPYTDICPSMPYNIRNIQSEYKKDLHYKTKGYFMGLHFIFGGAGTGKTKRCCEEIRDYLMAERGRSAFLLVPDQETYTAERMLADCFPGDGFIDATVCGFSRLAYRVFQELHSPVKDALSPLGQQLIIRRILNEKRDGLQILLKASSQPHFSEKLVGFFHQLDMFCISENDLQQASLAEEGTPLGKKLADLSLLYRSYHDYLRTHFSYEGSLFDLLAREIPKSEMLRHSRIWIDGFNGMAPQKINIVSALLHTAEEVTFTLQLPGGNSTLENETFARPFHLYEKLLEKEKHASSTTLNTYRRFSCPRIRSIVSDYFDTVPRPCPLSAPDSISPDKGVHLFTAPDTLTETDFIARRILSLVRDKNLRWRDILVLLRTTDSYADRLDRSFAKYRIPAFIDKKETMNSHPLVMLIDGLLRLIKAETKGKNRGFTRNYIFRILKTHMLPALDAEEIDKLENYSLQYNIRFSTWQKEWTFREYRNLDDAPAPLTEKEAALQKEANGWREKVLSLLNPFLAGWKNAATVQDKCAFLYHWLVEQEIPQLLSAWDAEEYEKTKRRPHAQVWKKILQLLDEIVHVAGSDTMKDEEISSILEDGLSSLTFSMIPPTLDHITVTSMDRGYAAEAKVVFIPGVTEGAFPQKIGDDGFFTESEKQLLWSSDRISLGNSLMEMVQQEQFYTYLALTRASDALYLSCPDITDDGTAAEPSFLFTRLKALNYFSEYTQALSPSSDQDDASFFANPDQALSLLPAILRTAQPASGSNWSALKDWAAGNGYQELLHSKLSGLHYKNIATPLPVQTARKLFMKEGRFYGSVTKLQKYRSCPYQYFLKYGLGIDERKTGEPDHLDYGNYLHAGLHKFGEVLKKQHRQWRDASDTDIRDLSKKITEEITPRIKGGALTSDQSYRYTQRVLDDTFHQSLEQFREWSRQSEFDTIDLEKPFFIRISVTPEESFTLTGKIDRVDASRTHVVVYDYKTGSPKVSLNDIVHGVSLQLITYLLALSQEKDTDDLLPAAMMYMYLHSETVSVNVPPNGIPALKKNTGMNGILVDDPDILRSLDKKAGTEDGFISATYKTDGSLRSSPFILNASQFDALKTITEKVLIDLYSHLTSGRISIRPMKNGPSVPCSYCPYRSICRFDPSLQENNYNYIPNTSNTEIKKTLEEKAAEIRATKGGRA